MLNIINVIGIITVFQLVLLGFILLSHKKGKALSHRLLSAFMFANALLLVNFLNNRLQIIPHEKFMLCSAMLRACYALLLPLLYLYIKSACLKNFRLRFWHLLNALPYFGLAWYYLFTPYSYPIVNMIFSFLLHIQNAVYSIVIFLTFYRYRIAIKAMYSSIEKASLSWLLFLFLGFVLMWLSDFAGFMLYFAHINAPHLSNILLLLSLTINLVFATGIVICGLKQLAIFSGIDEKPKYATSQLRPQDYENYLKRLTKYMQESKPYLDPDLSLEDLAVHLSMPLRYLSQVINQSAHQNFFEFINRHRIDEFKRKMIESADPKITILEMLYNVGFNSKSSFNQAFKKCTGITPSEFIKQHRIQQDTLR
jgi:AraC-like DNA-binding protein